MCFLTERHKADFFVLIQKGQKGHRIKIHNSYKGKVKNTAERFDNRKPHNYLWGNLYNKEHTSERFH